MPHQPKHPPRPVWEPDAPLPEPASERCPVCDGRGKVPTTIVVHGKGPIEIMGWCAACGGDGKR